MDEGKERDNRTAVKRRSDREFVVTRTFDAPAHIVFEAWTRPELCNAGGCRSPLALPSYPARWMFAPAGRYRFEFGHPASEQPMAFFGTYLEVVPHSRLVWTNEESADAAVTTVTFEEKDGKTHLVLHDLYPSKEALDAAIASGSTGAAPEQFAELDKLLVTLGG